MRRRDFIALVGAMAVWPTPARAQRSAIPTIGFLQVGTPDSFAMETIAFRKCLAQSGYVEGRVVIIEYRGAEGRRERLPELAADLVNRRVAALVAMPSSAATAAKAATSTIPIVFVSTFDPVNLGLVSSIAQPGGNVTGVSLHGGALETKQLEVLREVLPKASVIGLLVDPANLNAQRDTKELLTVATGVGQRLIILNAANETEIETAFDSLKQQNVAGLIVGTAVLFLRQRAQLVSLATRHAIPTVFARSEYTRAGGLMSYGADLNEACRLAGMYAARVLKGEKPANLPVQQATKIELVINLKAAKALGLSIPLPLLGRADEVIE